MKRSILTFCIFFLIGITAFTQAPESFKYQAVARDAVGDIIPNQAVALRMSIVQGTASGTTVYSEEHAVTTNDLGLLNLTIGSGTIVSGDFSLIDWGSDNFFIQVEMDISGGTSYVVMGTTQLLSVPYALHAKTVENDVDEQTLNFNNVSGELTISNGNTITLPMTTGGDNWGSQAAVTDATLSGDGTSANPLAVQGDLTDDQNITGSVLTGTSLTIGIENGTSETVDLSSLVDDADNDPTNELQDWSNLPGIPADFSDGTDR